MTGFRRSLGVALTVICLVGLGATASAQRPPDVEYVPTPQDVVVEMLKTAGVGQGDVVYDLGCGDGRFVITAAKLFGARGVGIDIDPERIRESTENAKKAGVSDRVEFIREDLFTTDFREATVVALYLLPELNLRLRPRLLRDLKPGSRIVSHEFDMNDWVADRKTVIHNARFISSNFVFEKDATYYYWIVPVNAAGRWAWNVPALKGGGPCLLQLSQNYQDLEGTLATGSEKLSIAGPKLSGDLLSFFVIVELDGRQTPMSYSGRIRGDDIEGVIEIEKGPFAGRYDWTAHRSR